MYLIAFPLLLIPFALYNMIAFLLNMPFTDTVFIIPLAPDRRMPLNIGDLLIAFGMLLLYVEVLKAARFGAKDVMDHFISFILLVAMVGEFMLVPRAATPTLFLLAVLGFVDLITGLSLSVPKRQKIVLGGPD
jgi:hypothetical protein